MSEDARARRMVAQFDPVGPCSPYRAEAGDIPSEMPGCSRRRRPVPGSLADELQFRRNARDADGNAWDPDSSASDDPPRRAKRRGSINRGTDIDKGR